MLLCLGLLIGCTEPAPSGDLTRSEIRNLAEQGTPVVDVRTPREYRIRHVPGSTNVPIDELEQRISEVAPKKEKPVIVHCQSGGRSAAAKETLQELGYRQVIDLGSLANAREVLKGAQP
jgi:phage shock protein E